VGIGYLSGFYGLEPGDISNLSIAVGFQDVLNLPLTNMVSYIMDD
jgi:hypothetical protein